jgi:23S rRNA pseudouridine1911/1915/1917 synthase
MKARPPPSRRVGADLAGHPVDAVVRTLFGLSWGRARELVRRGKVAVDGRAVLEATTRVKGGAEVVLDEAARDPRTAAAELPPDAIVYVDAHVVVVEKPAGISTVPFDPAGMGASIGKRARPGEELTLDARVRAALARIGRRAKERGGRGEPPPEIGIVHRLDKETSGLIVFTRSWAAKKALTQAFRVHAVQRRYLAVVHGIPRAGTIASHFVEDRGDGLRGSVERRRGRAHPIGSEKTQRAVTHVEVVERFSGRARSTERYAGEIPCALVACKLETGRTHQIRIHLAEAGHPLLGERVYVRGYAGPIVPAPRVMLHAAELGFVHPATGKEMSWTSDPPEDMREVLRALVVEREWDK